MMLHTVYFGKVCAHVLMRPSDTLEKAVCFVKEAFQFAKSVQQRWSAKTIFAVQCHTLRCIMLSNVVQEWKTSRPKLKFIQKWKTPFMYCSCVEWQVHADQYSIISR